MVVQQHTIRMNTVCALACKNIVEDRDARLCKCAFVYEISAALKIGEDDDDGAQY